MGASSENKKSECVLIGDSKYDAIGAEQAGIDFIAVTYGFGFKIKDDASQFPNVVVVGNVEELMKFFNFLNKFFKENMDKGLLWPE